MSWILSLKRLCHTHGKHLKIYQCNIYFLQKKEFTWCDSDYLIDGSKVSVLTVLDDAIILVV